MFEHSIKVPRHYKIAANILKKVSTEGGSVKTLLYDDKLRHFRTNVLYALVTETIKHAAVIDKIFENCKILENESRLDPWLAKILTAELLFGKKTLPGKSKPEQTVFSYKEQFERYTSDHQDDLKTEVTRRPRYVRINTNLLTTSDAIRAFQDEGYHFIRCTSGSYADYLEQIQNLTEEDFTQDYHVKTIFVFSSGTKLHEHALYLENKIILQDKATAMAVHLLAPPPGSTILDMCAAPGMKTTQLAAFIRNTGKVYAVERNENRYRTLCDFVMKTSSQSVETIHKDALEIKKGEMDDVEYILLDPSCSGSGMELCVHSYIESSRLAKLTSLQEKFLKHAMNAFPNAKRIVYSTCSLFPEENERVITNVVKTSRAKWRVQEVKELLKGQWNNFGSRMYGSMGARCMYARPDSDLTTGFFLAVLDRDERDLARFQKNRHKDEKSKKKDNIKVEHEIEHEKVGIVEDTNTPHDEMQVELKSKKKKHKIKHHGVHENIDVFVDNSVDDTKDMDEAPKRKKKKLVNCGDLNEVTSQLIGLVVEDTEVPKKKKKKDKHIKVDEIETNTEDTCTTEVGIAKDIEKEKKNRKKRKKDSAQNNLQLEFEPVIKKSRDDREATEMTTDNTKDQVHKLPKKKKNHDI